MLRALLLTASGAALFGSSCASDVRDQMVAGGLDFVKHTTGDVLAELFPITDMLQRP
ncbi:MAG: hypothetical protein HY718_19650 [Planctomycetes bacterium]|nr:hypothetical protein [Planctomycetota bacterium]